jgi:ribosomal protein L37AE/L43A
LEKTEKDMPVGNETQELSGTIKYLVAALELEIAAIKEKGISSSVEVFGGQFKGQAESNFLYTFLLQDEVYLRDDSPIKLIIGRDEVNGTVVSFGDGILVISVEKDFGPKIPHAKIISDDSFLMERLKEKLVEVSSDSSHFSIFKAEQVIGNGDIETGEGHIEPRVLLGGGSPLNEEQQRAIAKAIASDVAFVWGPPGTGKTTVLARIVEAFYYAGMSVLLVSNTNIAVDTALEKIAERLRTDEGFQKGTVIRHGPIVKPELECDYGDAVNLDKVIERLAKPLLDTMASLQQEKANAERRAASMRQTVQDWETLYDTRKALEHTEESLKLAQRKHQSTLNTVENTRREIAALKDDLSRYEKFGKLRRIFSGIRPETLKSRIVSLEAENTARERVLRNLSDEIQSRQEELPRLRAQIEQSSRANQHYPPYEKCQQQLKDLDAAVEQLVGKIVEVQKQVDQLRSEVIANCRVLATTVYRTFLKGQIERSFDVVVIDEASMLALPMSYYASGLATNHVVVAGDFRQLPPIIMADGELADEWLKKDVFYKAGIPKFAGQGRLPRHTVALRKQYRMPKQICDMINTVFYDDFPLETCTQVERGEVPFPFGDSAFYYIDTGQYHPWTSMKRGTYSRYNLLHAIILSNLATHLRQTGYLVEARNAGAISPYSAQTRLLKKLLDGHKGTPVNAVASTVHSFQGNEKNVILIDITDSLGSRPSKFIQSTHRDEDGARLLNVALSRARSHIVLTANFEYLAQTLAPSTILRQILAMFEENGTRIELNEILSADPAVMVDTLRSVEMPNIDFDESASGIFNEATFFPAFRKDLLNTNESVVIFSPFVTMNGTGRLMDILGLKCSQGIGVRLVSRPCGDQGGVLEDGLEELFDAIAGAGVVVDFRASMHEKFAIIDRTILWYGSLNIFSHRNTTETMFRIVSPSLCEQIMQFVAATYEKAKDKEEPNFTGRENPDCPKCSRPMVWKHGRYGVYFECPACGEKSDPRRSRRGPKTRGFSKQDKKTCPKCGRPMKVRRGKYGPFWGCTGYPQHCRNIEKMS